MSIDPQTMEELLAQAELPVRDAGAAQLNVGDSITATVVQPESPDGRVVSRSDALDRDVSGARWRSSCGLGGSSRRR